MTVLCGYRGVRSLPLGCKPRYDEILKPRYDETVWIPGRMSVSYYLDQAEARPFLFYQYVISAPPHAFDFD